jgi:hypothetical protein
LEPQFQFYEIVKITNPMLSKEYAGKHGVVLGRSQDDEQKWNYAISLYDFAETVMFHEDELESTGQMDKPENFYTGENIKVKVDPETGEGYLAED